MSELTKEKVMTTKEVAEALGVDVRTVQRHAQSLGLTQNGKQTLLNEAQATKIKNCIVMSGRNDLDNVVEVQNVLTEIDAARLTAQLLSYYNNKVQELNAAIAQKDAKITADAPKVDYYDAIISSGDAIDMKTVADVINKPGYGRTNLFRFLRDKKVLNNDNVPYRQYIDAGYFKVVESKYTVADEVRIGIKTVVFQKGVKFIKDLIEKQSV